MFILLHSCKQTFILIHSSNKLLFCYNLVNKLLFLYILLNKLLFCYNLVNKLLFCYNLVNKLLFCYNLVNKMLEFRDILGLRRILCSTNIKFGTKHLLHKTNKVFSNNIHEKLVFWFYATISVGSR